MLKFKLIEKKDLSKGAAEDDKLFYPQLVGNGRVSFDAFCDDVAEESALTSADVKACMDRVVHSLVKHLREGRTVDLGDMGTFGVSLRSSGAKSAEAYDPETMMREPSIIYYPAKDLKKMRKVDVRFERITTPTDEPEDDEQQGIPNP